MILELTYYGNPILRKKAAPISAITDEIRQFAKDLVETMHYTKNGIGLAAPQVGRPLAIFVVQFPKKDIEDEKYAPGEIVFFINPKILEISEENWLHSEGCLSIPGVHRDVERPIRVKIQAQNIEGETFINEYVGYEARMILHENDHLNGVLFIDRLDPKEKRSLDSILRKIKKQFS